MGEGRWERARERVAGPNSPIDYLITRTGVFEWRTTRSVMLPSTTRPTPLRPWVVITTREGCSAALSMMACATFWCC